MTPTIPPATPAPTAPARVITQPSIAGLTFTNSADILNKDSRLCMFLWAPSGYGKTHFTGGLDDICQEYLGKRCLYIPVETGEGGGAATIRLRNVPLLIPKDFGSFYKTLSLLRNDKTIGGVVFDSATEFNKSFVKPEALKYPARENVATRLAGIPTRSDYQTMGELSSQVFRALIALTTHENPEYRKHLIVTAADATKEEDERITFIGPDLPGRMRTEATQMFQQVLSMEIKPEVVAGRRSNVRYLVCAGDGVRAIKDRFAILPERIRLKSSAEDPQGEDLPGIYRHYYLPAMERAA